MWLPLHYFTPYINLLGLYTWSSEYVCQSFVWFVVKICQKLIMSSDRNVNCRFEGKIRRGGKVECCSKFPLCFQNDDFLWSSLLLSNEAKQECIKFKLFSEMALSSTPYVHVFEIKQFPNIILNITTYCSVVFVVWINCVLKFLFCQVYSLKPEAILRLKQKIWINKRLQQHNTRQWTIDRLACTTYVPKHELSLCIIFSMSSSESASS
jgi:hypothetical protein